MAYRNKKWFKEWHREGNRIIHQSGLAFIVDEVSGLSTCDDSLSEWQALESASGALLVDIALKHKRLTHQAEEWNKSNTVATPGEEKAC